MLVGSHNGTVNHRVFVVRVGAQYRKDAAPYALFGPATPPAVGVVPTAKAVRKVTPGGAGAVPMYNRVDEPAVIHRRYPDRARPSWQRPLDQVPLVIAELVGAHGISLCWC